MACILSLCFIVSLILSSSGVYAAAIKDMDKVIIDPLGTGQSIDFNIRTGGSGFSSDDFLADLDAFNITKFFVDCEKNSIANAFYGYYNSINKNKATKGNRFYEFIYTATLDLECATMPNIVESFRRSACSESNVGYENGRYWEADIRSGLRVHLMGGASYQTRKICAKLFCDYIIALSGRTE